VLIQGVEQSNPLLSGVVFLEEVLNLLRSQRLSRDVMMCKSAVSSCGDVDMIQERGYLLCMGSEGAGLGAQHTELDSTCYRSTTQ